MFNFRKERFDNVKVIETDSAVSLESLIEKTALDYIIIDCQYSNSYDCYSVLLFLRKK